MRSQKTLGYDTEGRVSGCENLSCSEGWFTRTCVKTTDGRLLTTTSVSCTARSPNFEIDSAVSLSSVRATLKPSVYLRLSFQTHRACYFSFHEELAVYRSDSIPSVRECSRQHESTVSRNRLDHRNRLSRARV